MAGEGSGWAKDDPLNVRATSRSDRPKNNLITAIVFSLMANRQELYTAM